MKIKKQIVKARKERKLIFNILTLLFVISVALNVALYIKVNKLEKAVWETMSDYADFIEWRHNKPID